MPRVTLEDVAKKAGVSFKTVSRVLNNESNVASKTLERVRQAIAELNYVPNSAARRLSRGKAMSIGFDDNPYASMVVPPLTTIHQPIGEIACTEVKHLIQRIDDPSTKPIDLIMPTRLVIRDTCVPPTNRTGLS